MLVKYRKRPVIVQAFQWRGENITDIPEIAFKVPDLGPIGDFDFGQRPVLVVQTLEGPVEDQMYDYIICGTKKEWYPCKPDIFEAVYDRVDEADHA